MTITYDFDMFSIMPKELQTRYGDMFQEVGMSDMMKEQRALFRDPRAVEALQGASESVIKCLIDSGFGINVYDSGAGSGRFPQADEAARMQVLGRLRRNLSQLSPGADWNGFDIRTFLAAAAAARPTDTQTGSLRDMRGTAHSPAAPTPANTSISLDDFFTAKPVDSRAHKSTPVTTPDMDAFFSNAPGPRTAMTPPSPMSGDLRLSVDAAPPPKAGMGPMKMGLMALGLFLVVSVLGNGDGASKLIEVATGGKIIAVAD